MLQKQTHRAQIPHIPGSGSGYVAHSKQDMTQWLLRDKMILFIKNHMSGSMSVNYSRAKIPVDLVSFSHVICIHAHTLTCTHVHAHAHTHTHTVYGIHVLVVIPRGHIHSHVLVSMKGFNCSA